MHIQSYDNTYYNPVKQKRLKEGQSKQDFLFVSLFFDRMRK